MLITFSGLDGSGKSTLIAGLKQTLEQRNKRVAVFHMYYDVGLLAGLRYVWKKVGGEKETLSEKREAHSPRERNDDGRHATLFSRVRYMLGWNKSLRLFVYPFDLLIFLFYRLYIEKVRRQILIMDRYFYDTLVDVAEGRKWYGVHVLSRLTPTPSLPVLVDISPEEAFSRKGEHSVAYLSRRRLSYQKLFPKGEGAIVLAGGDNIKDTQRRLEKIVMERLAA